MGWWIVRGLDMQGLPRAGSLLIAAVLTVLLVGFADDARAVDCQSRAGKGSGWAWQTVDGKRCWFKRGLKINNKVLRWPSKAAPLPDDRRRAFAPETPPPMLEWPEMPPLPEPRSIPAPLMFEERWWAHA
jgi:hypothetical protein